MGGWLRRGEGESPIRPRDGIDVLMPRSARGPEGHRFDHAEEVPDGEADPDIAFVASLTRAVDNETARREGRLGPAGASNEAALDLFREYSALRETEGRPELRFVVGRVEISDLVEDLETLAAALRRRKAA